MDYERTIYRRLRWRSGSLRMLREPIMMFKCHCRDCRSVTGGGFVAGLLVPAAAFRLTKSQLRYHFTPRLAGGRHKRGFCPECGSRLTSGESDAQPPGFVGIRAGSLDDPAWFQPTMEFFTGEAQPWDQMDPNLLKYEQCPPMLLSPVA